MSGTVSFSFSKKAQPSRVKIVDSKLRDESTKDEEEETDFITSVVGNEIKGTKKTETHKEWIIPLIKHNNWRLKDVERDRSKPTHQETTKLTKKGKEIIEDISSNVPDALTDEALERQALKELLEEAGSVVPNEVAYEVPLLIQNHVPVGYEEDDNMDVSLRPDQSSLDDYEKYPVDQFGKAMLRGMGWKEEEGIGKTNKGVVDLKEPTLRPKGLGLGAERPQSNKDAVPIKSAKGEEAKLVMKIGAYVKINKGPNKGLYGQIQSFDEDNNRLMAKLALTSKIAAVSKFYVDVVSETEFKTKSKVLNIDKYEEYKKIQDEKERDRDRTRTQQTEEDNRIRKSRGERSERERDLNGSDEDLRQRSRKHGRNVKSEKKHRKDEDLNKSKRSKKHKKEKKKKRRNRSSSSSSSSTSTSRSKLKRRD